MRFAAHGANVAINYLTTPDEAAATEEQVHACVRKVQQHGVRDVLIQATCPARTTPCSWSARRPRASAALCAREAIKRFLADDRPVVVINLSSVHQIIPKPNYLGYSVTKGGYRT